MDPDRSYRRIVAHYESCLDRHGDTHLGVDWPRAEHVDTRHRVMLDLIRPEHTGRPVRLLDFGCGTAHLYQHILEHGLDYIDYTGLDLSEKFVRVAERKFPGRPFVCLDLLDEHAPAPGTFDYVVANGVFTEKRELSFDDMFVYFSRLVTRLFEHATAGLAFNVMSTHVDWERDDLFHVSFDRMAAFVTRDLTRNVVFRMDYGLYEYTTYVYR
jgi:SAM-dependent methyltransferase